MHLDRALRVALRNFSTFFLIVALVTVPLNVAWGLMFRDVVALQEIHDDIRALPDRQNVRGVGPRKLDRARYAQFIVLALEVALIPLMLRATRRAIEMDESGHLPSALGAWRGITRRPTRPKGGGLNLGVVAATLLFAAAVWLLAFLIVAFVATPVPGSVAGPVLGLGRGLALALALPFFLVGLLEGDPKPDRPNSSK